MGRGSSQRSDGINKSNKDKPNKRGHTPRGKKKDDDAKAGKSDEQNTLCFDFLTMGKCHMGC